MYWLGFFWPSACKRASSVDAVSAFSERAVTASSSGVNISKLEGRRGGGVDWMRNQNENNGQFGMKEVRRSEAARPHQGSYKQSNSGVMEVWCASAHTNVLVSSKLNLNPPPPPRFPPSRVCFLSPQTPI